MWSSKESESSQTLHPWRSKGEGVVRVKRDWIIPPIRVLENSKQVPENLVQVTTLNKPPHYTSVQGMDVSSVHSHRGRAVAVDPHCVVQMLLPV